MAERDQNHPFPHIDEHTIGMYDPASHDAHYGEVPEGQVARVDYRTARAQWVLYTAAGTILSGVIGMGAYSIAHNEGPSNEVAVAPTTPGSETPTVTPSATSTSESPSPSPSKTTQKPTHSPSPTISPSDFLPSPSQTSHKVVLPPSPSAPATTAPAPETSAPQACVWPESDGIVTVGECGDHTAYNDEQRTGAHQLPVGMQFGNVCMKGAMVAVHYGGGYDLVDNHGYFTVPGPC